MSWHARLDVQVRRDGERCVAHVRHEGPLRVLKTLYPEGHEIAHQVIVHPPGGIVGGDRLDVVLALDAGAHLVITTPGATRFYRSAGDAAQQQLRATVGDGARLEWLPLETIAHSGCIAESRAEFTLADGAEMIGWDVLALGLPAADEAFMAGRYTQHLALGSLWLERGVIDSADQRLLQSPLGLAGHSTLLTLWFAAVPSTPASRLDALVDGARELAQQAGDAVVAGVTLLQQRVIVLRALAHRVEPAMALAQAVRARWRDAAWQLSASAPRVWRT